MPNKRRLLAWLITLALALSALTAGCSTMSPGNAARGEHDMTINMAPMEGMPPEVKAAPSLVKQAYQFAAANPEVLKELPCYCGCGAVGHKNNYQCYVKDAGATAVRFDLHATGCGICVDITQDAMRLTRQGKSVDQIRTYVNSAYAKYGPPTTP